MRMKPACVGALLFVVVLSVLRVPSSVAVPAFARRENAKCQMCHLRLPELNEDGHSYIRRGLRAALGGMAAGAEMGKASMDAPMPPGMDMHTTTGPAATNPDASTERPLGEPVPLAWEKYLTVMGHHMLSAHSHERPGFRSGTIDVWVAGPVDPHWSGLANVAFDVEGGGVGVEQAYVQYNTSRNRRFFSARFGQLMPFAILFNGGGAAMPLSAPLALEMPLGTRNPWAPTTLTRGVELGAVDLPRWNAYLGAGQPQIDAPSSESHTDLYGSAEYLVGEGGDAVSLFGYRGQIAASAIEPVLDFSRVAAFANLYAPRAKGVLGVLWGSDSPIAGPSLASKGAFLLGEFLLTDQWAAYGRYDYLRHEVPAGEAEATDGPTVGMSFWAHTQIRLTLEAQFLKTAELARERGATAEVLWAF